MDRIRVEITTFERGNTTNRVIEKVQRGEIIAIVSHGKGVLYIVVLDSGIVEDIYPRSYVEIREISDGAPVYTPHFAKLRERFPILTDDEIVAAALNFYEMHTSSPEIKKCKTNL